MQTFEFEMATTWKLFTSASDKLLQSFDKAVLKSFPSKTFRVAQQVEEFSPEKDYHICLDLAHVTYLEDNLNVYVEIGEFSDGTLTRTFEICGGLLLELIPPNIE
jgi:hypothetical protein